jgi:glycosyltransferase involved in cell wall biosynthesis
VDVNRYRMSVVMPVRDRFSTALTAVERIIHQTERPFEILIVDDGSVRPFEHHLEQLRQDAAGRGVGFKICRHELSRGVSAARNQGVAMSQGDIICFCDSDDYWEPRKLEIVASIFNSAPEVDVLCHSYKWIGGKLPIFEVMRLNSLRKLPKWLLIAVSILNPSCFCVKRTAYQAGFKEDMKYHEDLEYFLRISKRHDIWFLNDPLTEMARPPGSAGGASHNKRAMRQGAVRALSQYVGLTPLGVLALLKICYHKAMLFLRSASVRSNE